MLRSVMHVTVTLPSGERRVHALAGEQCTIGRRPECDIFIDSPSVSRMHAELVMLADGEWELRDLESLNGIEVDGRSVTAWRPTEGGEAVLGDARLYFGDPPSGDSTIILKRRRRPSGLWVDPDHRCLRDGDRQLGERLAPREFELLKLLADAQGHVVARRALEEAVWGTDAYDDNALHQLVRRTREKIGDDRASPRILITLPGVGYRLNLEEDSVAG
jgi:DNA-binding winged helix-turn-helix (wHTH) protein